VLGLRHIQLDEEAGAAAGVDLGLDLLAGLFQKIPNDHLGTLMGKEPGFCSPLAPGAAANERHLAFQSHGRYPLPYNCRMMRLEHGDGRLAASLPPLHHRVRSLYPLGAGLHPRALRPRMVEPARTSCPPSADGLAERVL